MDDWIKTSDELPYDYELVMVTTSDYRVHIGYLVGYKWYLEHMAGLWLNKKEVIAWKQMPEPFRG